MQYDNFYFHFFLTKMSLNFVSFLKFKIHRQFVGGYKCKKNWNFEKKTTIDAIKQQLKNKLIKIK